MLSISSLFLAVSIMNGLEQPIDAELQELQEALYNKFQFKCAEVTEGEVETVIKSLRNHPDLQQKHSEVIAKTLSTACFKAKIYRTPGCAQQNCNFLCEEFGKLTLT